MRSRALVAALVAALVGALEGALEGAAMADPLDETGTGAAGAAMAGARTAVATGAEAAHVNPAGMTRVDRPEVLVGWQYDVEHLELDGHAAGVSDAHGTTFGLAIPLALGDLRLAVGTMLYLPDQYLARLQVFPTGEPQYVRFGTQRMVIDNVVAAGWHELAIGAGVSTLADTRSRDLTFDVGVKARAKVGSAHLDVALPTRFAPVVGVMWRPHPKIELGATFRGQLSLDLAIDIVANVDVPNVVTGSAFIGLRSTTYFTPMRAALGGAVHVTDDLLVTADLAWEHWRGLGSGVPDLHVLVKLDLAPPVIASPTPPANFHDIVTPRVGAEWRVDRWRLRAGVAYLPSPVPAQTGVTSFADGTRVLTTAGAGVRLPAGRLLARPIDLDLAVGWQHVAHELVEKDPTLQPGGAFSSGGDIVQGAVSATVRF